MSMFVKNKKGRYIVILGDGKFHETVSEGTPDAVLRRYETSDGKEGSKWEMVYDKIIGRIIEIDFHESDYGRNIQLRVEGEDGEAIISVQTGNNFGSDIMKKLPNIDYSKNVTIEPYNFINNTNGKTVRGVTFWNGSDKATNYFWDTKKKETCKGFPKPPKEYADMGKNDWKIYFLQVDEFLTKFIQEKVIPNMATPKAPEEVHEETDNGLNEEFDKVVDETAPVTPESDENFRKARSAPKKPDITKFRPKFMQETNPDKVKPSDIPF